MLPQPKNYTSGRVSGEAICAPTPAPGSPRRTPRGSSASPETAKPAKMRIDSSDMARRPRRAGRWAAALVAVACSDGAVRILDASRESFVQEVATKCQSEYF